MTTDKSATRVYQYTTPGLTAGVNRDTLKIFCRRVHTCGYCTNQFSALYSNGRRPCPQCQSFKRPGEA